MLDGILGRGFASKCKSLIKLTKRRIDVIRRKRNATLKFLKKDMADLLANGLDVNAYGRAEGLLAELNQSSCYDFIEKSCDFILKHLQVMQKIGHCPEDCRAAVSSLMFAAARFSDLPELRDLRQSFYERYGNSVELFVNQEFVEKLSSKPFTSENKVQLMQDIASEFSIKWDSKAFEHRMSKPSAPAQGQQKSYEYSHVNDDNYKSINGKETFLKREKHDAAFKERLEHPNNGYKESNTPKRHEISAQSRHEVSSNECKPLNIREETALKRDNHQVLFQGRKEATLESNIPKRNELGARSWHEVSSNRCKPPNIREETVLKRDNGQFVFQGRQEATLEKYEHLKDETPRQNTTRLGSSQRKRMEAFDGRFKLQDGRENIESKVDDHDILSHGKPARDFTRSWSNSDGKDELVVNNNYGGEYNIGNSAKVVQEEEIQKLKHYHKNPIPPPYTKPKSKPKNSKYGASLGSSHTGNESTEDTSWDYRANAGNRSEKSQQGVYHPDHERLNGEPTRLNGHGHENISQDDGISNPIPKPRSSRRRHLKSRSRHDDIGNLEGAEAIKGRSRSRRRDDSKRGLKILFDDEQSQNDEEERMMDRLLIHYSKKPSAYEPGNLRRKSKSRNAHDQGTKADKSPYHISIDGSDEISEMIPPPTRSISLPHEQPISSETKKAFTRAASFQPDRPACHVHPKLPNYDDLATRFAALKGR